ncbi:hypothetical protein BsWGS_10984 [Bradybaena similaris]
MAGSFRCSDGEMYCEKINLKEMLKQLEARYQAVLTPLFVYSRKKLQENVQAYIDALRQCGSSFQLNFSIKANQNLTILREFQSLGLSATLVSGNELRLALEAGFEPTSLMFNGGGKCAWETHLAIKHGVLINVDSEWDLKQTLDICQHGFPEPKKTRVQIRMNLNIDPQVHKYVNTGMMDCKFGLSEDCIEGCLRLLEEPGCPAELVGLHCHAGSTIYETDVFKRCTERLLHIHQKLVNRGFTKLKILNVGGGLGIDYLEKEDETRPWRRETELNQSNLQELRQFLLLKSEETKITEMKQSTDELNSVDASCLVKAMADLITDYQEERISFHELKDAMGINLCPFPALKQFVERLCPCLTQIAPHHASPRDLVESISGLLKDTGVTLMLEPGRSLVANTAVLLARVLGCKMTANKRYLITDASMTEVIRPCLYGSYHHVSTLGTRSEHQHVFDIVGPVCESADFIGKDRLLPNIDQGFIVVHDVGAYCHSMSSNYNARMKAAEVLVDDSTWRVIRRQDNFEDFLAPYKNLE